MRTSCALQNKTLTFQTLDIPYFIIWSEIIFFRNISDHDVGSRPWKTVAIKMMNVGGRALTFRFRSIPLQPLVLQYFNGIW